MRLRAGRLTAYSAFAALALGAAAMVFERAGPSVLSAGPDEFTAWARLHHRALTTQSVIFALSSAPLLVFFAGLRACLDRRHQQIRNRLDVSLVVLGAGAAWVTLNLVGQAVQASMAAAAARGAPAGLVTSQGDLMVDVLAYSNAALGTALGATALAALRDGALPRWLGWLSAVAALVHLWSVVTVGFDEGAMSGEGALAYLPYPVFVAWLVGVAVALLRADAADSLAQPVRPDRGPA